MQRWYSSQSIGQTLGFLGLSLTMVFWSASLTPGLAQENASEADRMFQSLDSNRDGRLTLDEGTANTRGMLERIFEMAEKGRTGSVSRAEFQRVFERHRAGNGPRPNPGGTPPNRPDTPPSEGTAGVFGLLDQNQDGRISRAEANRFGELFSRIDANGDGQLSAEEWRNAAPSRPAERSGPAPAERPTERTSGNPPAERPAANAGGRAGQATLTGTWRGWVVRGRGEQPNEGEMEIELTITGNRIVGRELGTRRAPGGIGSGTFTIDGDGKSGNLDSEGTSGPQDGRTYLGIYELNGNTLRWCVSNRGRQRPEQLATDRGNYLLVLNRETTRN